MTINEWLTQSSKQLASANISSAQLDAEIILTHSLKKPRTYLHAHGNDELDLHVREIADARLDLRLDRVPIAYITGHKEFYGRLFTVTTQTLIPRPESEEIIEQLITQLGETRALEGLATTRLVDIGTGSGILGITAKLIYPELDVTLLDTSKAALLVAERNATRLKATVTTMQSDLLGNYPFAPDITLANLPYVGEDWERSPETNHEPPEALFASRGGLSLIDRCFEQLSHRARSGSIAILEADPRQWDDILVVAKKAGYSCVTQGVFAATYRKD